MAEIKRRMKCPYCGYECETGGIGRIHCGPHVSAGAISPAVPMREIDSLDHHLDLCQDSPDQGESKGSGSSSLPNCQSGSRKTLGSILREAREAWELSYTETGAYDPNWRLVCDESAAQAVRNAVIEECIAKAQKRADLYLYGQSSYHQGKSAATDEIISDLRSLKGSTDNDDT